jgi:hypothetical protein
MVVSSHNERNSRFVQMGKGGSQEMLEGSRQLIPGSKNPELATQEITNGMNEMPPDQTRLMCR